jgi:hypothetical protein
LADGEEEKVSDVRIHFLENKRFLTVRNLVALQQAIAKVQVPFAPDTL